MCGMEESTQRKMEGGREGGRDGGMMALWTRASSLFQPEQESTTTRDSSPQTYRSCCVFYRSFAAAGKQILSSLNGNPTERMDNEEESNLIESLRQRYRREAQIAIEDARNKTKQEMNEIFVEKMRLLEEEARKWKCIAEGLSEEQPHFETETDPKAPLLRYIMEGVGLESSADLIPWLFRFIERLKKSLVMVQKNLKLQRIELRFLPSCPPGSHVSSSLPHREHSSPQQKNSWQSCQT
jgi:hypothetical protein